MLSKVRLRNALLTRQPLFEMWLNSQSGEREGERERGREGERERGREGGREREREFYTCIHTKRSFCLFVCFCLFLPNDE